MPLADAQTPVNRVEMRAVPRYPILQRCFVHPAKAATPEPWKGIAYNISACGIGITLPIPLPVGTLLTIEPWNLPHACSLQVRIIHTKPVEHVWFAGCELVKRLTGAELHAWRSGPIDWVDDAKS